MDLNYAMSYRITTLEIEQAAVRAERARMAAEHGDQIVRTDGLVRRALQALSGRRGARRSSAREAVSARQAAPVPAVATASADLAPVEPAMDDVRAGELVGCAPHAA